MWYTYLDGKHTQYKNGSIILFFFVVNVGWNTLKIRLIESKEKAFNHVLFFFIFKEEIVSSYFLEKGGTAEYGIKR